MARYIPKKKIGIFLGFLVSATVGQVALIGLTGLAATYAGLSFFSFWYISLAMKLVGATLGAALCVQGLKHFSIWPLEDVQSLFALSPIESTKFSLTPSVMWRDLKGALREFDRELLKIIGENWFNSKGHEQDKILEETANHNNYSWWDIYSMIQQKLAAGLLHLKKETLVPGVARATVCEFIHELSYNYQHRDKMPPGNSSNYEDEIKAECLNYQSSMFMFNLHAANTGFFESIANATYNEYEHPPKRHQMT
ncbi:MAG: hypothetical protein AB7V32_03555 [Candidatus Berkiella sp.]